MSKPLTFSSVEEFRQYEGEGNLEKGLSNTLTITRKTEVVSQWATRNHPYTVTWSQYSLSPLPGCCGVVVSHGSMINISQRNKGLGDYFHKERLSLVEELGYSCAICTVISGNKAEERILEKNGWKKIHSFVNSRTSNLIDMYARNQ